MKEGIGAKDRMSLGFGKSAHEGVLIVPNLKIELFDEAGMSKYVDNTHNAVTNAGLYGVLDQILASPTLAKAGWMELGTGTGGATKLNAYVAGSRTAFDSKARTNAVVTMITTFGAGVGTGALTEAGVFDVVTQDTINMWLYATFSVVNKLAADSLVLTWTLTIS